MLLALISGLIGALIGASIARKRKGKTVDIIQYAGIYFIAFALLGLLLNTILLRML